MAAAKPTEPENAPGVQPDNYPPTEKRGLETSVAVFGLLFLCLNLFCLSCLAVAAPQRYTALVREDYWIEYLTVVWFLLAGLLLFVTARLERSLFRRGVYILGGIALLFVAGEEISWGQRVIGFETPDLLLGLNQQGEFNLHNIGQSPVNRLARYGTLLLCTVTCAAFFCRKDTLAGIPLPSILLVFGFLASIAYYTPSASELGYTFLFDDRLFIFQQGRSLLLFLVIYALLSALLSGQSKRFSGIIVATAAILAASWSVNRNSGAMEKHEVEEYALGIVCLCYALELLLAQAPARRRVDALFGGIRLPGVRESTTASNDSPNLAKALPARIRKRPRNPWLTVCALAIICSTGLIFWQYFDAKAKAAAVEERHRSIATGTAGEPIIRATFDVYLIDNELTYLKEPCGPADTEDGFFLHLIPANVADLPGDRRQYGFDNRDFQWAGERRDGPCLATIPLPRYPIAGIRTGQYVPDGGNIWQAEFAGPYFNAEDEADDFEEKYRSITTGTAGEPIIRATFDVYLSGNELTYFKDLCGPADTEDRFFLHLIPDNVADLPPYRQQHGFDNLDFGWRGVGARRDGWCLATIPLPDYPITAIRTGQFVPDTGQVWQVEFPFPQR